jgi:hypothetical protein
MARRAAGGLAALDAEVEIMALSWWFWVERATGIEPA